MAANPYYPPRARFWAPSRLAWWRVVRHVRFPVWRVVRIPSEFSLRQLPGALLVPGYAFLVAGYRRTGWAVMAFCVLALLTLVVGYGLPCAMVAFGLILAAHSISLGMLLGLVAPVLRAVAVPLVFGVLLVAIYWPLQKSLEKIFLPLQTPAGVVIVRCAPPATLERGAWVAYRVSDVDVGDGEVYTHAGLGLDRLLARGGDTVRFSAGEFTVNGTAFPRLEHMPDQGEFIVPKGRFFIWPKLKVRSHGMSPGEIAAGFMAHSVIPREDLVGVPCRWWFGRRPVLP